MTQIHLTILLRVGVIGLDESSCFFKWINNLYYKQTHNRAHGSNYRLPRHQSPHNLHDCPEHVRTSLAFPEQLLFRADAIGFWQVRDLSCRPPHIEVHAVQADQPVHPIAPEKITIRNTATDIGKLMYMYTR